VPGRYEDCRDASYARAVAVAYWQRWCPDALAEVDAETLARVHNGGPRGMRKSATLAYWRKVSAALAPTWNGRR
jgi:predicted chitinase